MVISSNYSIQQNQNKRQNQNKQQSFGNALAPAVAAAVFIENNGFLGEFLTIDAFGMGTPRVAQGYNRNKEELGHLNYKAGREELVRELLSGPSFFFVPAISLLVAAALRGKATKVTTTTLDIFKDVMSKTASKVTNSKDSKEIKTKFVNDFFDKAFHDYEHKGEHVEKLKKIFTEYLTSDKKEGVLGFGDKAKANLKKEAAEILTTLNKANSKNLDNTTSFAVEKHELDIEQMADNFRNYLENYTAKASESSEPLSSFTDKFHDKAKKSRQITNIIAGLATGGFLLAIPALYQTGKEFPGVDGLNTKANAQNKDKKQSQQNGKQTVNFSGNNNFDKAANWFNIDQHNSFTREMFLALSGIFMLGARFVKARDNDEKREVLTRDIPAVIVATYGAKWLYNGLAKAVGSISGIPVKAKDFVSNKQIKSWYSGFDKLQNPVITFAETIKRNNGKLNKAFGLLSLSDDVKGIVGKENATNEEIISALKKAQEAKDSKFVALETKLKGLSGENKLLTKAINHQACVKLGALGIVSAILGFGLPRLNIVMTRKKYQQNPNQQKEIVKQK